MMHNFYIDESGSMTIEYSNSFPFFVICLVKVCDGSKVKHLYKNLFKKHKNLFKFSKDSKYEIKGAKLSKNQKKFLAKYFNRPGLLEVYYIRVENQKLSDGRIYQNKARAFNYLIAKDFEHLFKKNHFKVGEYYLYIDNRNVKNDSIKSLEDYLYVKFKLENHLVDEMHANYFDSKMIKFLQIADFFSNLYYSDLITSGFESDMNMLVESKVVRDIFVFPMYIQDFAF